MILMFGIAAPLSLSGMAPDSNDDMLSAEADEILAQASADILSGHQGPNNGQISPTELMPQATKVSVEPIAAPSAVADDQSAAPSLSEEAIKELCMQAEGAVNDIDAAAILHGIKQSQLAAARVQLAEGLRAFKESREVLWATDPIPYQYTVDESDYELQDCTYAMIFNWLRQGRNHSNYLYGYNNDKGERVYAIPVQVERPDGTRTLVTKIVKECPYIAPQNNYDDEGSYINSSREQYRMLICTKPNIITKDTTLPVRFGIYKADIADAALTGANIAIESAFNRYIKNKRITAIADHMIEHSQETIDFLRKVEQLLSSTEKEHLASLEGKNFFQKIQLQQKYVLEIPRIKEVYSTFTNRIAGSNFSPFSKQFFMRMDNLPVILGRILLNRATDYLEKKYIIPEYQHAVKAATIAYKRNERGELVPDDVPPIPMVQIAKAIVHPKLFFQSMGRHWQAGTLGLQKSLVPGIELPQFHFDLVKMFCKRTGLPVPDWIFGPQMKQLMGLATDVAVEALSMKMFDEYCGAIWCGYLSANYAELIVLLENYQKAKMAAPFNDAAFTKAKEEIHTFVQKAHDPVWFLPASHWYIRFITDKLASFKISDAKASFWGGVTTAGGLVALAWYKGWFKQASDWFTGGNMPAANGQ